MSDFVRRLDSSRHAALRSASLFSRLSARPDIFPAIRENRVDFYFGGGKLFSFDGSFKTHIKYASVYHAGRMQYVSESQLKDLAPIRSFDEEYVFDRMMENCALFAGAEAQGVSSIYASQSYRQNRPVVVLDIEVAFSTQDDPVEDGVQQESRKQNRVDLLLFDTKTRELRFMEAKHFSNQELWAKSGTKPEVVNQIRRYEDLVRMNSNRVLEQYGEYVSIVNDLFTLRLPAPVKLNPHVGLLMFGFDADQKAGRFATLLREDGSLDSVKCYAKGEVRTLNTETLWNATT